MLEIDPIVYVHEVVSRIVYHTTMFSNSPFQNARIPETAKVIVVADLFVDDYVGGAELTTEALISCCPHEVHRIRAKDLSLELIKQGVEKFWIFGNFSQMNPQLIPTIVGNLKYAILEYDYKYCRFRSPEKHFDTTKIPCMCHNDMNGKMISAFMYGAMGLYWMSEKQKEKYHTLFPFLVERTNIVLSSVFDDKTLGTIRLLRENAKSIPKAGWIVLGSNSWVKGFDAAKQWVENRNLPHEIVWNLPYDKLLAKLAAAEGFVYLPSGGDTCPRMVIEAKLLGCQLQLNENVQHKDEEWFATDDVTEIEDYLYASKQLFWNSITELMNYSPKISGYITTYNCVQQKYPFVQAIKSMLEFCDEICVVDGGSKDGTLEELVKLAYSSEFFVSQDDVNFDEAWTNNLSASGFQEFPEEFLGSKRDSRIRVKIVKRDWTHPRFAVFDGLQKAEARKMCTGEYCVQLDSDEIIHEDDAIKFKNLCQPRLWGSISTYMKSIGVTRCDVISLPVIEYWAGYSKVRLDINPYKWRISRNISDITHGIPRSHRIYLEDKFDGTVPYYASPGTDGCDLIDGNNDPLDHFMFPDDQITYRKLAMLRSLALGHKNSQGYGNTKAQFFPQNALNLKKQESDDARSEYEKLFNELIENVPCVFHYSWFDLERKIRLYRDYWTSHWCSLRSEQYLDTAEQNMMFDCPWSEVTDEMIEDRAKELSQIGGWIWHSKWKGQKTPWITVNRSQPKIMLDVQRNKNNQS